MVIIDTSIAVKWFFTSEEGAQKAKNLLTQKDLGAPDLLLYEFTNVITCQPRLSLPECENFLDILSQFPIEFFVLPQKSFARVAQLSHEFKITSYDASFICLAEILKTSLITADMKLAQKVKSLNIVEAL